MKKIKLYVLSVILMLILSFSEVNAIMPKVVYNPINVIISSILKVIIINLVISYMIYVIKSIKDKKIEPKKLVIWFVVMVMAGIVLYFASDIIYEAGRTYTSSPMNF